MIHHLPRHAQLGLGTQGAADGHALELTRRHRDSEGHCQIVAISTLPSGRFTDDLILSRVARTAE